MSGPLGGAPVMVSVPNPLVTVFSTDFNVADGPISNVGMSENDFGSANVASNTCLGSNLANGACIQPIAGSFNANQWAETVVLAPSSGGGCGLALRANGYVAGYYASFEFFGSNRWQIWKRSSSANTDILKSAVTTLPAFPYSMRFTVVGTTLKLFVNTGSGWVEVLSATDSTHSAALKPGIFMFSQPNDPRVDSFACGNIV